ncbi:MAG: glycosyltransferase family 4 protein [Bacteroidetes bacterium]|nr:glycosyltransferase family 4 protein [Bacteroidota bacterium]
MHILDICQYFPPEMGAPAARAYEFSRRWVAAGHRVTVLCGVPNHPTGKVYPGYRRQWQRKEKVDGIDVHRMWVYVTPNSGMLRRSVNYLSFGLTAVLGSIGVRDVDICIASTPQFFAGLAGTIVRRLKRVPLCLEVRDLWPDSLAAVEVGAGGMVMRLLRAIERFMYRSANGIVIVSPAFRAHIEATGIPGERIGVVPNGLSTALFHARDGERRHFAQWKDRFLVGYVGTHGMAHGLETALKAARMLETENMHFVFVGEGARKEELKRLATAQSNVTFLDRQPREIIAEMLAELDVAMVLLRDTPLFRTVIPSKMFEIMGSGVPMVLGVDGQARTILEEADAGIAIPPGKAEALAAALRQLAADPALRRRYGGNASHYVRENYDLDALARSYLAVLQDTCATS